MWWNSWSSLHIWCTDTLVNLLWTPSMSNCPTRWWEKIRNSFPSPESTCLTFPVPVYFGSTHPACDPSGYFVQVKIQICTRTRCNMGGWRRTWKSWNLCDHVVMSCQPLWLISWMLAIGKQMTRLIMRNTMKILRLTVSIKVMSYEWMVGLNPSESCCQS